MVKLHRGLIATHPRILSMRPLTKEDIASLKQNTRVANRVKTFRETHHRVARLVAAGLRNEEILRITGFSIGRLSTLKSDPAFQELVANYRGKVDEAFVRSQDEIYETATSNLVRIERQKEEHLDRAEEAGELLPLKMLVAMSSDYMDRFGYSKKTLNTNVNVDFARELERAMARQGRANVIDGAATLLASSSPQEPPNTPPPEGAKPSAAVGIRRRW